MTSNAGVTCGPRRGIAQICIKSIPTKYAGITPNKLHNAQVLLSAHPQSASIKIHVPPDAQLQDARVKYTTSFTGNCQGFVDEGPLAE